MKHPGSRILYGFLAIIALSVTAPPAHGQYYNVVDLGTLGGSSSYATSIDDITGQIVGYSYVSGSSTTHAFLYNGTTMQDLGTLGTGSTYATGVNSSGQVVGYSIDASGNTQGFLYSGGVMQNLGSGRASGISDYGQIAFTTINANGTASAYEISGLSRYNLGTLGGTWTDAQVMNPNGLIAGSSLLAGNTARMAFMFTMPGQSLQNLSLNLSVYGYVAGISRSGNLAGCTSANGPQQAFVTGAFGEDPLNIDPNGSESVAYGINQKGQAVGFKLFGDAAHAFIWQGGLMTDLNTLLTPASSGWVLTTATDIDDAGQIVGTGVNPSGQTDAFLLIPTSVPEPPSCCVALFGTAALALVRLRRRRL